MTRTACVCSAPCVLVARELPQHKSGEPLGLLLSRGTLAGLCYGDCSARVYDRVTGGQDHDLLIERWWSTCTRTDTLAHPLRWMVRQVPVQGPLQSTAGGTHAQW